MDKWLILGWSDTIRQLADAIVASPAASLAGVLSSRDDLGIECPRVNASTLPEPLLLEYKPDVVLCGASPDYDLASIARLAVQSETTLIVEHGVFESITSFELEMLRHEATGYIGAVFPLAESKGFEAFQTMLDNDTVTHISIEQTCSAGFSIEEAVEHFAQTQSIIERLHGKSVQISAIATPIPQEHRYKTILVTVTNELGNIATWCLSQSNQANEFEFTAKTEHATHVLKVTASESFIDGQVVQEANLLTSKAISQLIFDRNSRVNESFWVRSAQIMETAENIPLSIRKRRSIPIHGEIPTEHDSFKGVMSMVGCFTLLFVLAIIFIFVLIDVYYLPGYRQEASDLIAGQSHMTPAERTPFFLRVWPVYPLILLLLMQFLRRIIRPKA